MPSIARPVVGTSGVVFSTFSAASLAHPLPHPPPPPPPPPPTPPPPGPLPPRPPPHPRPPQRTGPRYLSSHASVCAISSVRGTSWPPSYTMYFFRSVTVPSVWKNGFCDNSSGKKKSYLPLSISTGSVTCGRKF